MQVWILRLRQGIIRPATLIRRINREMRLIQFPTGQYTTLPHSVIFSTHQAALSALVEQREHEKALR